MYCSMMDCMCTQCTGACRVHIMSFSAWYMTLYGLCYSMISLFHSLLYVDESIPSHSFHCVPAFCSKGRVIHFIVTAQILLHACFHHSCPFIQQGAPCMCAQVVICCEPVPFVQCREGSMPFSCVLRAAIFLLLSTLPPRWRATSLTLMMMATQPCTWQPILVICPW